MQQLFPRDIVYLRVWSFEQGEAVNRICIASAEDDFKRSKKCQFVESQDEARKRWIKRVSLACSQNGMNFCTGRRAWMKRKGPVHRVKVDVELYVGDGGTRNKVLTKWESEQVFSVNDAAGMGRKEKGVESSPEIKRFQQTYLGRGLRTEVMDWTRYGRRRLQCPVVWC